MTTAEAPAGAVVGSDSQEQDRERSELRAFSGLTVVQIFQLASTLVTAPLIAHALGAEGRGMLAAILVPLGVAFFLLELGQGAFAVNRVAQGTPPRVVFGSLALPLLAVGVVVAALSPFIAGALSEGREPVNEFLIIGLVLIPVNQLMLLATSIALGLSQWRVLTSTRLLPPLVTFVGVVILFALGHLTVATAAAVTMAGGLAPIASLLPLRRRILPARVDRRLIRNGMSFGSRVWLGQITTMANQRLDQFLMIPLVPTRELGLYAVAVTIASISSTLAGQITTVILPRIAGGESHLVPEAVRCSLIVASLTGAVIAVGTHFLLIPLFGADFADAQPLVYVLLVAWVSQVGLSALGQALPAIGRPGVPSIGELVALAITVPGLIVLLPSMGAMGAALVSLIAYTATFGVVLAITRRHLGNAVADFLVPRPTDLARLRRLTTVLAQRVPFLRKHRSATDV
jgi:O-antigen/teichoic acid export membrane protein